METLSRQQRRKMEREKRKSELHNRQLHTMDEYKKGILSMVSDQGEDMINSVLDNPMVAETIIPFVEDLKNKVAIPEKIHAEYLYSTCYTPDGAKKIPGFVIYSKIGLQDPSLCELYSNIIKAGYDHWMIELSNNTAYGFILEDGEIDIHPINIRTK